MSISQDQLKPAFPSNIFDAVSEPFTKISTFARPWDSVVEPFNVIVLFTMSSLWLVIATVGSTVSFSYWTVAYPVFPTLSLTSTVIVPVDGIFSIFLRSSSLNEIV